MERRVKAWIRGLVDGQQYQQHQQYREMLLLTAIHFHAGQLVCQTTGWG